MTVAGTDMGNWSFHALTKVFSLNIYKICFNNTISFELLISGITSNPPNLSCSFSVICMPSQSSTETSRVIVSFFRDVIIEPAFLAGFFFPARNVLIEENNSSCVIICWVEIWLRRCNMIIRKVMLTLICFKELNSCRKNTFNIMGCGFWNVTWLTVSFYF